MNPINKTPILALDQARDSIVKLHSIISSSFKIKVMVGIEIEFYLSQALPDIDLEFDVCNERGILQYETHIHHSFDLISVCDAFYQRKQNLKEICSDHGINIDFSPKPYLDDYGSAAHYNFSIYDNNDLNLFCIEEKKSLLESIIATILSMTNPSLYLLTNGDEREFIRFMPDFMAPVNTSWGSNNRTTLIRIPDSAKETKRIEYRLPSPNIPPEYVILFLLTAVLEGLHIQQKPAEKIYGNAANKNYNLEPLLQNVIEAKKNFKFNDIIGKYI